MNARDVVGHILGKIGVHPDTDLTSAADEDHLLTDVEVTYLLVQNLETLKSGLHEI